MAHYLIIESRDPFESAVARETPELVSGLVKQGNQVTLFFIQNGVLPLRKETEFSSVFKTLNQKQVKLLADGFSLHERAITEPLDEVGVIDASQLIYLLFDPQTKVIWH